MSIQADPALASTDDVTPPVSPEVDGRGKRKRFVFLRNSKAITGIAILGFFVLMAIFGPLIAPFDPSELSIDVLLPPSGAHWLGTTNTGQDILSQILVGARGVMIVGFVSGAIATAISVLVGVTAGFLSGWGDEVLSLIANIFLVIPALPLIIIVASQIPSAGSFAVAVVISATAWAWGSRILRAQTLSLRRRDFVEAARANGESMVRIIAFEITPNLTAIIVSSFIGTVTFSILSEITLAFIGVTSISDWNWGTILFWAQSDQALAQGAWWWFIPAGLCIALVGTSLSLINFSIDEFVNPRLRSTGQHAGYMRRHHIRARIGFTPVLRDGDRADQKSPAAESITDRPAQAGTESFLTESQVSDPVLEIRNLSVDYGYAQDRVQALDGVTLTLGRGEVLGLAGESGCGKSTLAYGSTRLLPPPGLVTSGEVFFHSNTGESIDLLTLNDADLRASRWRDVAVVFQGAMNALNPVQRIETQLTDTVKAHNPESTKAEQRARGAHLLGLVGIAPDRLRAYPHQLSGGMKQRVMIAMALALEPQVLIMDEPTTALDVVMQRQIIKQIIELKETLGFSVIFITHDVSLLIEMADRIAIMYAGGIVEQGPAQQLYRQPRHPYTRGLLSSFPPLHGPRTELTGIPGSPPDLLNMPGGCRYNPRCSFVMDRCRTDEPHLIVPTDAGVESDRLVSCWLHEDPTVIPPESLLRRRNVMMWPPGRDIAAHPAPPGGIRMGPDPSSGIFG